MSTGEQQTPRESWRTELAVILGAAQVLGFVGPEDPKSHIRHAEAFCGLLPEPPEAFLDLGTGAGIPGLVIALLFPQSHGVLLDTGKRRAAHLEGAVEQLGLAPRISVLCARAEIAARRPALQGAFDLVTARSFGAPAVVAECATRFLGLQGVLAVSEPPATVPKSGPGVGVGNESGADAGSGGRWPTESLASLGFGPALVVRGDEAGVALIRKVAATPERWPRRDGVPGRKPLWV